MQPLAAVPHQTGEIGTVTYQISDGILSLSGGTISSHPEETYPWNFNETITKVEINGPIILEGNAARSFFMALPNATAIEGIGHLDTTQATDMSHMFADDTNLLELDLSTLNTDNVTRFNQMFAGDQSLTTVNVSKFDTSKAELMTGMFSGETSLTSLDLSNFDTHKPLLYGARRLSNMLAYLTSLTTLKLGPNVGFGPAESIGDPHLIAPAGADNWQAVGSGTPEDPEGPVYSPDGIRGLYEPTNSEHPTEVETFVPEKPFVDQSAISVQPTYSMTTGTKFDVSKVFNSITTPEGKVGYITANAKFVTNLYYQSLPKNKEITLIATRGIQAYKNKNLTRKTKAYKQGTHLRVKAIVKHNLTTRYQLSNGYFVSANKKLVIQGKA